MSTWQKDNRIALENDHARVDMVDKVTGRARYTTDYYPENLLWAQYIRCPFGNAELISSEIEAAKRIPGILEIEISKTSGEYPGDRMGHVCAQARAAWEEALATLNLKFKRSKPKTDVHLEKSPLESFPVEPGQLESIFKGADAIIEQTYETQVQNHCCLEPHICLVDYRGNEAIARCSTQGTFTVQEGLAETLGLRAEKIEMHCEHIGGGFGSKFGAGAEGQLAAEMSRKYKRPCRVGLNRKEEMTDSGNRPGSIQYMKVAAGKDGKLQGARIHSWGSVGPSGGGGGVRNPSRYDFGVVEKTHEDVHLNSGFPRAMRAPGHPQGMFAVSMMMQEAANRLGVDPLEFCKKNDPNVTRKKMYDVGAELIGWKHRRPDGSGPGPVKRGFGIGAGDWGNSPGDATVEVRIYRSGQVEIYSGSQDIGTGYRTVLTDVVAHQLGVPYEWVTAYVGVSTYPPGPASGGSVTSRFVAPKAFAAAEKAKGTLLGFLAQEWNVDISTISIEKGEIRGNGKKITWEKACKLISQDRIMVSVSENDGFWKEPTESEAVQFAEVEVDVETGIVRVKKIVALQECGLPVNRNTVENQITGGVIQGLSFALFENRILNRDTGAALNPNMEWYKIAGSRDIPEIVPVIWREKEDPGVNSLGEPPVIPTPGAIGCAVANAIGAPVRSLPITPDKVLAALAASEGGRS